MAQPFDLRTLRVRGEAVPIAAGVTQFSAVGFADFSVSRNGVIALGPAARPRQLMWFDHGGKPVHTFGKASFYQFLSLSPNKALVAADAQDSPTGYEIFLFDPSRGTTTQLTFGAATGNFPVWSPDGASIAFGSNRDGVYNIYRKSSSGVGQDELLLKSDQNQFVSDWSQDGRYLIYGEQDPKTKKSDLWALPMSGERKPFLYFHSDFDKRDACFYPYPEMLWNSSSSSYSSGAESRARTGVYCFGKAREPGLVMYTGARPLLMNQLGNGRRLARMIRSPAFRESQPSRLADQLK